MAESLSLAALTRSHALASEAVSGLALQAGAAQSMPADALALYLSALAGAAQMERACGDLLIWESQR